MVFTCYPYFTSVFLNKLLLLVHSKMVLICLIHEEQEQVWKVLGLSGSLG